MGIYLNKRGNIDRFVTGVSFFLLASFPWLASPMAAGVVGTGTPGSCTQAALTTALSGGGTVTFNCGGAATILMLNQMNITADTVIDGGGIITINGGLTTRLFRVVTPASLTLTDITLQSGITTALDTPPGGGAIHSDGNLSLNNVTIKNSTAGPALCGGAIFANGTVTISNSSFSDNSADYAGGAICTGANDPTTTVQISNSSFSGNKATNTGLNIGLGGAIFLNVNGGHLTATDTGFVSNQAHFGGALYVSSGGSATLQTQNSAKKVLFLINSATADGGAIYNLGNLNIYGAELNANTAPENISGLGYGGAIANRGNLTLHDSTLTVNRGRFGGGLFVGNNPSTQADIQRTTFGQNTAAVFGGGLFTIFGAIVTVVDSVFRLNTANSGGGIARFEARLDVKNSSLTDNLATAAGGGLYIASSTPDPASVSVTNVTFGGNRATVNQGGGVYNSSGFVVLKNITVKDNTNGLYNTGTFTTHLGNSVLDNPGSPNCNNGSPLSLDGNNLSTDNSCLVEKNAVPAQLGPQATNTNGINQTRFYPPLAGSPLINGAANCPSLDQRGASRLDACDIGAIEYGGLAWHYFLPIIEK
jgi:predicted outer membrane repeat protein